MRTRALDCVLSDSGVAVLRTKCDEEGTPRPLESEQCTTLECAGDRGLREYALVKAVSAGSMCLPTGLGLIAVQFIGLWGL